MKQKTNYFLLALSIILFTSCESKEANRLDGNWEVISMKGKTSFNVSPNFVLNTETLKIAGFSGCNRFFGSLKIDKNKLSFHEMGGTRMACPNPTVENLFITTIPEVASFDFDKNLLQFKSESGEVVMTMKPLKEEE
jgi:heat shock protein HslJ